MANRTDRANCEQGAKYRFETRAAIALNEVKVDLGWFDAQAGMTVGLLVLLIGIGLKGINVSQRKAKSRTQL